MDGGSDTSLVTVSQIADLAEVRSSAVSNWRKRFDDFPHPSQTAPGGRDLFDLDEVEAWLARHGKGGESRNKRLLFSAADRLRSEVAADEMVAVLGAALALVAYRSRGGRLPPSVSDAIEDLLSVAEVNDPELADTFRPLLEVHRETAKEVLRFVVGIEEDQWAESLEWILSRGQQNLETRSGNVLTALIEKIVGEVEGTVYDPAAGTGGFLLALWRQSAEGSRPRLYGQEINRRAVTVARQRLLIEGVPALLARGDSLVDDAWPELRADIVVCDPPYGVRVKWPAQRGGDPRWPSGRPPTVSDFAWLHHVVHHLAEGGRGYVFLPTGTLFRGGKEADLRRQLLAEGVVEAIVTLPPGSIPRAAIPVALWVLRQGSREMLHDGVLLIDATPATSTSPAPLSDEMISRVAQVLKDRRSGLPIPERDRDFAAEVPALDLLGRDANLAPNRWMSAELTKADRERQEKEFRANRRQLERARLDLEATPMEIGQPPASVAKQWVGIDELLDAQAVQLVRGMKVQSDDYTTSGIPVIRARDLTSGQIADEPTSFIDPAASGPPPMLTQPGDIVISAQRGGLVAAVDERGERVLASPLQGLRLLDGSMHPELVAAFLESPRNRRMASGTTQATVHLRNLEIPILARQEARDLLTALTAMKKQQNLADAIGSAAGRLQELLLSFASSSFVEDEAN